jgi:glycine cleavage system regulatory protein
MSAATTATTVTTVTTVTTRVLISFFCADRPGVVEALSSAVDAAGGNWLDSQLSRLGGRFAGVVLAALPADRCGELEAALHALLGEGITAHLSVCDNAAESALPVRHISILGPDRHGIVLELTRALRAAGFNVLKLNTAVETAAMSGEPLFRAEATVELLEGCRLDELEWQLDAMAERMTLDIDIHDM